MPVTQPPDFNQLVNKPTTLTGYGITDASRLGVAQSWSSQTRVSGTTYYNTSGKPIVVFAYMPSSTGTTSGSVNVNGNVIHAWNNSGTQVQFAFSFVVPDGNYYVLTAGGSTAISAVWELR